ncbi:DUF421 domain-containing protein [Effusibacillus consociatus]|uniref:DUF421 domain-containing protein n=1 Tax=Effusibacillus consociatus TaxID=1117041 RepID=A0ABV9Q5A4_9BACL
MGMDIIQLFWEVPIIFLSLFLLTRIEGKKQISQLTYFDYVTGITTGSIAAAVLADQELPVVRGIVALVLWAAFSILASLLSVKSRKIRKWSEGEAVAVIKEGRILEKNLKRLRLDVDNLRMLLRGKNVFSIADVEFAVMETNGSLSVLKKAEKETVTRKDMGLQVQQAKPGREIIVGGVLDQKKLAELGLSEAWLQQTLQQNGFQQIEDVGYMEITGEGQVYIDPLDK